METRLSAVRKSTNEDREAIDKILPYFSTDSSSFNTSQMMSSSASLLLGEAEPKVKEHCLATLIDQHINVTEHVYLAHQRLHVDLRNFMICRRMVRESQQTCQQVRVERTASTNVDIVCAQARKRDWRPFVFRPRKIHRLFHGTFGFAS